MRHACPEYAFFCRLLVDNFERHLIKKAGGGRVIHIVSIYSPSWA